MRAAFAVFDDFVVVLDAPLRSAAGDDLLAAVRAHAPDKEIRHAVFGHHHPHYSGGLRPPIHAGVTVVTTAVRRAPDRGPRAQAPRARAREPRPPQLLVVDGRHVFIDATGHAPWLHDIGAYTEHTDSYLVDSSPRERPPIEGDPTFFPVTNEVSRVAGGRRARASDRGARPRRGEDRPDLPARWSARRDALVAGEQP